MEVVCHMTWGGAGHEVVHVAVKLLKGVVYVPFSDLVMQMMQ